MRKLSKEDRAMIALGIVPEGATCMFANRVCTYKDGGWWLKDNYKIFRGPFSRRLLTILFFNQARNDYD